MLKLKDKQMNKSPNKQTKKKMHWPKNGEE